jgi:hypothetical protein
MTSASPSLGPKRAALLGLLALGCLAAGLARPSPAEAQRNLQVGLFDDLYVGPQHQQWLKRTAEAGAGSVRIPVRWKYIAPTKPGNPRQPNDPSYRFGSVDNAVRAAQARGLEAVLTVTTAPRWA